MIGASAAISAHMAGASRFVFSPGPLIGGSRSGRLPTAGGAARRRCCATRRVLAFLGIWFGHQPGVRPRRRRRPRQRRHRLAGAYRRVHRRTAAVSVVRSDPRRSAARLKRAIFAVHLVIDRPKTHRWPGIGRYQARRSQGGCRNDRCSDPRPKGREVVTTSADLTINDVVKVLAERKIGALVVVENSDRIVGIVSERDIVKAIAALGAAMLDSSVASIMTRNVVTCSERETHQRRHGPHDARTLPASAGGGRRPADGHRLDRRRGQGADRGSRSAKPTRCGPISPRREVRSGHFGDGSP